MHQRNIYNMQSMKSQAQTPRNSNFNMSVVGDCLHSLTAELCLPSQANQGNACAVRWPYSDGGITMEMCCSQRHLLPLELLLELPWHKMVVGHYFWGWL